MTHKDHICGYLIHIKIQGLCAERFRPALSSVDQNSEAGAHSDRRPWKIIGKMSCAAQSDTVDIIFEFALWKTEGKIEAALK
jgi:hypothetical protein